MGTRFTVGLLIAGMLCALSPATATAFCGFYVTGADASLYNNATQAVLMREGLGTVLSIQNNYKGPAEDFAMVVPVPIILQEADVKTLEEDIFAKVDTLTAPRLVEYWEQDPCALTWEFDAAEEGYPDYTPTVEEVEIEAEFVVGEYQVKILSAQDANALDSWLRSNGYQIPEGAAQYLDPYVQAGMYFFVAEVDPAKVEYRDGLIVLSPLRFHYDSQDFSLPIRLGLINSQSRQDLLVYLLGRGQRYDVANYPNTFIPTNIVVQDEVRNDFGAFYQALFDATLDAYPGAVVTEYAWNASSCDPCPGPVTLDQGDYQTLGADVLYPEGTELWDFVITRLHARYTPENLGEDLVFRRAEPVVGGRDVPDENGQLSQAVTEDYDNSFQGRYVILHPWEGGSLCLNPHYGNWGYPTDGSGASGVSSATSPNTNGQDLDDATANKVNLAELIAVPIDALGTQPVLDAIGCGGCQTGASSSVGLLGSTMLLALGILLIRRTDRS